MSDRDHRLVRYLHGELPPAEAQALRRELAHDPALAARLAELERLWQGLELPPVAAPPPGYAPRLARLAEGAWRREDAGWGLGMAPPWAKALVAASLATGLVVGLGLGERLVVPPAAAGDGAPAAARAPRPGDGRGGETPGERGGAGVAAAPEAVAAVPPDAGAAAGAPRDADRAAEAAPAQPAPLADAGAGAAGDPLVGDADDAADAGAVYGDVAALAGGTTFAEAYWEAFGAGEAGW